MKCDACIVVTDPSATRGGKTEMVGTSHNDMAKMMGKSFECCIDMAHRCGARCAVAATSYSTESKYGLTHIMSTMLEQRIKRVDFKDGCSSTHECTLVTQVLLPVCVLKGSATKAIRCQPHFEMLMPFSKELREQKTLSWNVDENAAFCPVAMTDKACACVCSMLCLMNMMAGVGPMKGGQHHV
jgi:hypothetical protein